MGSTTYATLLQEAQPQIICNERSHKHALKWVDRLMKMKRLSAAEQKLLELLSKLVNDYEEKHYPTPEAPPEEILQHLLETSGKSQSEFARAIGISRSTISEVLRGKRKLSVDNAFLIADYFCVDVSLFLVRP